LWVHGSCAGWAQVQKAGRDVAERTLFWTLIQDVVAPTSGLWLCAADLVTPGLIGRIGWRVRHLAIFPRTTEHISTVTRGIRAAPPTASRRPALGLSASSIRHDHVEGAKASPARWIARRTNLARAVRHQQHASEKQAAAIAFDRARSALRDARRGLLLYEIREPFR